METASEFDGKYWRGIERWLDPLDYDDLTRLAKVRRELAAGQISDDDQRWYDALAKTAPGGRLP